MIEHLPPVQRGNVRMDDLTLLNAILYVAVNGCTWRGVPPSYGRWHTVYTRMSRWAKADVLDRVFEELHLLHLLRARIEVASIKVHPDGTGALEEGARKPSAETVADSTPRFICSRVTCAPHAHEDTQHTQRPSSEGRSACSHEEASKPIGRPEN